MALIQKLPERHIHKLYGELRRESLINLIQCIH